MGAVRQPSRGTFLQSCELDFGQQAVQDKDAGFQVSRSSIRSLASVHIHICALEGSEPRLYRRTKLAMRLDWSRGHDR